MENSQQNGKTYPDSSKIFVGGLARNTTEDDLRQYFSVFGNVVECNLKRDFTSGLSRGFAFVTFDDPSGVEMVIAKQVHTLDNKNIDPKKLKSKECLDKCTKVFVGGVDPNTPEATIREYFQQYGKIESMDLPFDKEKNQRRGFCFVNFDTSEAVDNLCTKSKHPLGEKEVEVKRATPQDGRMGNPRFGAPYGGGDFVMRGGMRYPGHMVYPPYNNYGGGGYPGYYNNHPTGGGGGYGQGGGGGGGYGQGPISGNHGNYHPGNGYSVDPYNSFNMGGMGGNQRSGVSNGKNNRGAFSDRYN